MKRKTIENKIIKFLSVYFFKSRRCIPEFKAFEQFFFQQHLPYFQQQEIIPIVRKCLVIGGFYYLHRNKMECFK